MNSYQTTKAAFLAQAGSVRHSHEDPWTDMDVNATTTVSTESGEHVCMLLAEGSIADKAEGEICHGARDTMQSPAREGAACGEPDVWGVTQIPTPSRRQTYSPCPVDAGISSSGGAWSNGASGVSNPAHRPIAENRGEKRKSCPAENPGTTMQELVGPATMQDLAGLERSAEDAAHVMFQTSQDTLAMWDQ